MKGRMCGGVQWERMGEDKGKEEEKKLGNKAKCANMIDPE